MMNAMVNFRSSERNDELIALLIRKRVRGLITAEEDVELENRLADRSRAGRQISGFAAQG